MAGVKDDGERMLMDCGQKSVRSKLYRMGSERRESYQFSGKKIGDHSRVNPPALKRNMRKVGCPDAARMPRGLREKRVGGILLVSFRTDYLIQMR